MEPETIKGIPITEEKRERAAMADNVLEELYPEALCSLEFHGDPWRLLVMGRLSAQCTDERVNIVCETLFEKYPDVYAMAAGDVREIEDIVRPCGLGHGKAVSINEFSQIIAAKYGGRVPDTMETLLELPGVGRKIANLILGDVYGKGGTVADTHCMRICGRLGFYPEGKKDPVLTERVMDALIPEGRRSAFCHRIVHFGREWCTARAPRCDVCKMKAFCLHYSLLFRPETKK